MPRIKTVIYQHPVYIQQAFGQYVYSGYSLHTISSDGGVPERFGFSYLKNEKPMRQKTVKYV